jgi:hypothetical protein
MRNLESTARLAGVLFPCVGPGKVRIVVLYIGIGGAMAELAGHGWVAGGRAWRLFFDDTLVFVAIVMFGHCSIEMIRKLRLVVFAGSVSGGTLSALE